jgi:hypothetical protein
MSGLMTARRAIAMTALLLSAGLVAGCASGSASNQPLGRPKQIVMTSPMNGYAVWPSGVRFIVISTTDGWRTVTNRTPLAVPTDGGMVLAATPQSVVTGVLPYHLLKISPVLTSSNLGATWTGSQLPGALIDSPHALARLADTTYAVLAKSGHVVAQRDGQQTWATIADAATLVAPNPFTPTGVSSPDGTSLVLTGSSAGKAAAFASTDAGTTWIPVPLADSTGTSTADVPCPSSAGWLVPVHTSAGLVIQRGPAVTGPFTTTPVVVPANNPVIGCGGGLVWVAVTEGDITKVLTIGPTGAAHSLGQVTARITNLAPTGATQAVVATSDTAKIGTLITTPSLRLESTPLPTWVATVGGPAMRN